MKHIGVVLLGIVITIVSCKKKSMPISDSTTNHTNAIKVYLSSDKNSIRLGQEAVITASVLGAEGNMNYEWEVNSIANLLGSGNTVTFSPCCSSVAGDNIIKCTVTDAKENKGIGQITIVVNP